MKAQGAAVSNPPGVSKGGLETALLVIRPG